MSTLAVNSVTDANGGNTATINSYTPTESNMAGRNRIINGDMRIAQRGTSATPTTGGYYTVDRLLNNGTAGILASIAPVVSQSTDAPAGFINSFLWTNTNAVSPLIASEVVQLEERVEGTNVADLAWGTANAKTVTLSFWVKSSLTGTFGGSCTNQANNRTYPFTYSISSASTWEYKTVIVEGETTGTWLTDTGIGLRVIFSLGCGPNRLGTAGSWSSSRFEGATGQVQLVETAGATFYITGVQLEVGSVATPFERRPYGQELSLCQRYFSSSFIIGTAPANSQDYIGNSVSGGISTYSANSAYSPNHRFPVSMRTTPTMTLYSTNVQAGATANRWQYFTGSWLSFASNTSQNMNQDSFNLSLGGTWAGNTAVLYMGAWSASAEL